MPAGASAAASHGQFPGQEALDLKVCMNILKKAIVLIPVFIMLIIYVIRVTLTHHDGEAAGNGTMVMVNNISGVEVVTVTPEESSLIVEALSRSKEEEGEEVSIKVRHGRRRRKGFNQSPKELKAEENIEVQSDKDFETLQRR